jgi:hypothetical protein
METLRCSAGISITSLILGTPSEKEPWMLQFGGHHLALNITITGERGVITPSLTRRNLRSTSLNGKTVRPLGQESDKAIALVNALDESQRKQAILGFRLADLVLGPGQDGKTIQPEGLKASAMTDKQRAMLLDVISEWVEHRTRQRRCRRMAEIKADLSDTWFAWSGPTTVAAGSNITAYYRIQGPRLVIEYAPQTLGGDPALHVHTIYRDPSNDYGRRWRRNENGIRHHRRAAGRSQRQRTCTQAGRISAGYAYRARQRERSRPDSSHTGRCRISVGIREHRH